MACAEIVCHGRQNITLKTVLNIVFVACFEPWNFVQKPWKICATASERKKNVQLLQYNLCRNRENLCSCLSKCVAASGNILCFLKKVRLLLKANVRLYLNIWMCSCFLELCPFNKYSEMEWKQLKIKTWWKHFRNTLFLCIFGWIIVMKTIISREFPLLWIT